MRLRQARPAPTAASKIWPQTYPLARRSSPDRRPRRPPVPAAMRHPPHKDGPCTVLRIQSRYFETRA